MAKLLAFFPALIPLYLFRGNLMGIPFTVPEVLIGFAFLVFAVTERIWQPSWWKKNTHVWKSWPLLLFFVAGVISFFVTPASGIFPDGTVFDSSMRALGILKGWIFFPMLYFFMARKVFYDKPSMVGFALRSLLLGGAVLSILALRQVLTGDMLTVDGRASGPFESANYLSLYVAPLVLYAFFAFLKSEDKWDKIYLAFCGILCAAALFFTYSYAAWLGLFAALACGLFLEYRRRIPKVLLLSTFFVLVVLGLSQVGSEKFEQFLDFQERSSTSVRLQVYEISLGLIRENPLLGLGLGQYELQYQLQGERLLGGTPFESVMLHPHNILLAFWLNMGLLGLIAALWLVVKALGWLLEPDKKERRIAALMLLVILGQGLFDTPYFKNDLAFQFWLLMAILL